MSARSSAQVGIGVGVGLAIARNDTAATIGDGTLVADAAGVQVAAGSSQNTSAEFANKPPQKAWRAPGRRRSASRAHLRWHGRNPPPPPRWARASASAIDHRGVRRRSQHHRRQHQQARGQGLSAALAGKVGVGASIAILRANNSQHAWIGEQAEVTAAGLQLAGRNHLLNSSPSFDWTILDDLENRFTEANLQVLLGESNYYTETIAGAGGEQVAVTGSFSVNVFDERTEATIGDGAR